MANNLKVNKRYYFVNTAKRSGLGTVQSFNLLY